LQQAECALPGNGRLVPVLKAEFLTHLGGLTQAAVMRVVLKSRMGGQCISFEEGGYLDEKDLPLELTAALVTKASELLSLRQFQNEHLSLYLNQLEKYSSDRRTSSPSRHCYYANWFSSRSTRYRYYLLVNE